MKVITLGTGAGRPTLQRSSSATALECNGRVFLFDCGENTQLQFMRSSLKWINLKAIFITHLHGDHVNGLPGLLGTMGISGREAPLTLVGPKGIKQYLSVLNEVKNLWIPFPTEIIELESRGKCYEDKDCFVQTAPLDHVIDCWGYRFQEKDKPGRFDEEKAKFFGIPEGPLRANLVRGHSIQLASGQWIHAEELVGPKRLGLSMSYCLDTRPCQSSIELSHQVNLIVHEGTFDHSLSEEAIRWGHSTCHQAAQIAAEANAKELLITHISPRYLHGHTLFKEAQEQFAAIELAEDLGEKEIIGYRQ